MLRILGICALLALLVAGAVPTNAAPTQVEPQAGNWKTWILTSGSQVRAAPPPDRAATIAELQQLQAMAASRDDATRASIAYWDAGAPGYRWDVLARDESFKHGTLTAAAATTRQLAYIDVAIYDATVAVWDSKYAYNRQRPSEVDPSLQTAIPNPPSPSYPSEYAATAAAAATVLSFFYPDETDALSSLADEAALSRVAAGVEFPSDSAAGMDIGRKVAGLVLDRARHDGGEIAWDGNMPTDPGLWSLDGYPAGTVPVGPTFGKFRPWVLESGSQFRPGPPPDDASEQKLAEIAEIKEFQHTFVTDSNAMFWQSTRSAWPVFAEREIFESRLDRNAPRAARVEALLNITGYDAMVGCFDAKYTYWARRPFQVDPEVRTLFATPAHPSYPSAHGCISGAQSAMLAYLFPADAASLNAAGQDAAESRITAGIHYRSDVNVGLALGRSVAAAVIDRVQRDGS